MYFFITNKLKLNFIPPKIFNFLLPIHLCKATLAFNFNNLALATSFDKLVLTIHLDSVLNKGNNIECIYSVIYFKWLFLDYVSVCRKKTISKQAKLINNGYPWMVWLKVNVFSLYCFILFNFSTVDIHLFIAAQVEGWCLK